MSECDSSVIVKVFYLFVIAFIAGLLYLFLEIPEVECWFRCHIPNRYYRVVGKALLFFVLIYIFDRILFGSRQILTICGIGN